MTKLFFLTTFPFLTSVLPGLAESYTLGSAVPHALLHNADLAAAKYSILQAKARLNQVGRLSNPELESELRPNIRGREVSFGVGFLQKFPLTQRLRLEKNVSQAEVIAAEAEVRAMEQVLSAAVRTLGAKFLGLAQRKALKQQQIANLTELAAAATKIAEAAEGSVLDASQLELEVQQMALDLLQIESARSAMEGEARPLLGVPATEEVIFKGELPPVALPDSISPNLAARGDFQAAQAKTEAARQSIDLAKANKWDDIGIGIGAEVERAEDAPDGLETDGIVGVKLTLPLPFWNKNEGKIQEAEAATIRAEKEADALAARIKAEAAGAAGEMKAAHRILSDIDAKLLPKAREIEGKIAGFYKQGQPGTALADVLRSRERRLALEQAKLDALEAFHLARIRFDVAMGR